VEPLDASHYNIDMNPKMKNDLLEMIQGWINEADFTMFQAHFMDIDPVTGERFLTVRYREVQFKIKIEQVEE